jgi:hypothetical protein
MAFDFLSQHFFSHTQRVLRPFLLIENLSQRMHFQVCIIVKDENIEINHDKGSTLIDFFLNK